MNIVNNLVNLVNAEAISGLSEFLGESIEKSSSGLESSLKMMLSGLADITKKKGSADSILKVIKDGGHSGDLIDDLSSLFGKKDKLQLLITIGKNINTHFFQSNLDNYAQEISSESGVSESSASSLMNLAAPLLLGKLGKSIKTEGWTNEQFTAAILHEGGTSAVRPLASDLTSSETETHESFPKEKPAVLTERKPTKESNLGWLAWLFLALLGLSALYYTFKGRLDGNNTITEEATTNTELITTDSSAQTNADEMFDALNPDRNKNENLAKNEELTEGGSEVINEKSSNNTESTPLEINRFSDNSSLNSSIPKSAASVNSKNTTRTSGIRRSSSTGYPSRSNPNNLPPVSSTDNRPMSSKLESSEFVGVNGLSYKYASAEIVSEGLVSELVRYLQANPGATVEVKGGGGNQKLSEDRAYALKGLLYQKGISTSRVRILSQRSTDGPVAIRVNS